jgi:hypothetical protein
MKSASLSNCNYQFTKGRGPGFATELFQESR